VQADVVDALGGSDATPVTPLRCFCFDDKESAWGWRVEGCSWRSCLGWLRSRVAGGWSGGRSGAAVEASEDRSGAVAGRQVAAAAKQVTATRQLTVASSSRGTHAVRRAWRSAGRFRGGVAARGERGDEAAAHAFGLVGWHCSTGPGLATVSRRGLLASGPVTDSFSKFSKPAQTL
jgi:hypothetical protein